jgi:hypothetical protein
MAGKLGGKIALVAGGSSGIGLATAKGVHDGGTVSGLMSVTSAKRNKGEKMTVAELMRNNFDKIFIELDPVKREAMMRNAYTEDCVWIHPGGRLVGIAAINEAASEIRKRIPEYRYTVVGDIHTMHNVGMCRWGSGLPDQPFRYTGTDVVEERDGRVAVFYTFIDSGTPPVSSTE